MDLFSDHLKVEDLDIALRLFRESRMGFLQLFDNSPVCMSMTTTTPGRRVYQRVNKKFLEKFGFTETEIIGHTSTEIGILDEEESLRVGNIIKEKGRLQNDYVKCLTKSGDIVHTVSSIENMEINHESFLVSFFVDVTQIFEQQAIIEQHAQQLEAMNKELEAFSYSVSHDLRAPLRAINGYTKILEDDFSSLFDEEGKRTLAAVQRNAQKMNILIDNLLDFAMLGRKPLHKKEIDLTRLTEEVWTDLKKETNHHAQLRMHTLHSIQGDEALLQQVMVNLISNAVKYSSRKENPLVEITSEARGHFIAYIIRDNGVGFDKQYAHRLFGVFQRLHSVREFEGTGIGLATVQRIVNKHGGTIQADSEAGKGAVFTFTLPV
jgi:PAS domain S-box-containing protein